jgi:Zn-dependent protease with chaperone function
MVHLKTFLLIPVKYDRKRTGIAWACGLWPLKSIVIGMGWFGLTPSEQQAALAHEAGHCRHFHLEKRLLLLPFAGCEWAQAIARRHELEADAFAVRHGHGHGMLQLVHRALRVEWAFRDRRGPPTLAEVVDRLLSPAPEVRAKHILRLSQEISHEPLAA